ncbi:hypothetical protein Ct61P_15208 [Colletotrichum tofieldiae]|nr:hypothetical protein Ct61P_15208 [Colletotrichum tofieldiae]
MSRHSQSQSKSQPQSNRRQLLPVASAPATTPPHASLGFAAVRLAIQARGPDGPIQFLDICLHDDWQPNSSGLTLHLAGSDATWAPDTSNGSDAPILLGWPVDNTSPFLPSAAMLFNIPIKTLVMMRRRSGTCRRSGHSMSHGRRVRHPKDAAAVWLAAFRINSAIVETKTPAVRTSVRKTRPTIS